MSHPSLLDLSARASPGSEELCLRTRDRLGAADAGTSGWGGGSPGIPQFPNYWKMAFDYLGGSFLLFPLPRAHGGKT